MRVLIAGASGFIGRALVDHLAQAGHDPVVLTRGSSTDPEVMTWDPARHEIDPAAMSGTDAVINLAGENIAAERWSGTRRVRILKSRLDATSTLVAAARRATRPPAIFLNASAVGFYGSRGDEVLTEAAPRGTGFLADVCEAWELEGAKTVELGARFAALRFGTVLAPGGGALGKLLPVFRLGLGGRIGHGRQWMSWIHRDDAVRAIVHLLEQSTAATASEWSGGAVNLVAPAPVTNAEFTQTLAKALHRPAVLPVPAVALRLALGQLADEALLSSTRAVPERLLRAGFKFEHPTLESALAAEAVGGRR